MQIKARKLVTTDVFAFMRIIKKAGIKKELSEFAVRIHENKDRKNSTEIGLQLIMLVMEAACDVEQDIYNFASKVTDIPVKQIEKLEISELVEVFKAIVEANDLKSFFINALSLAK